MDDKFKELVYTDGSSENWLFKRYYYSGSNSRYWTFQLALNLLRQKHPNPVIIETGCQRLKEDLGAGMSTSIFGEYCKRYNGKLYTVDLIESNLNICKQCTTDYSNKIEYVLSDSVAWLKDSQGITADLLYLDSWDHPYGEMLNVYGGQKDLQRAINILNAMSLEQVINKHWDLLKGCQEHCLNEFKAARDSGKVKASTIILIDDNQLPGGGKSRLLKDYLRKQEYICLLDLQQSLWVKEL